MQLAFFNARAHCWAAQLVVQWDPRSVYAKLLPRQSVPSLYWCLSLYLPWCRTFHLLLLIFTEVPLAHFSGLLRFPWRVALLSIILTVTSKVVSSVNLLKAHCTPSSWSSKKLQNIGPSVDPWWMSLVTGHQLDLVQIIFHPFYLPHIQPISHQFDEKKTMGECIKDHSKA